MIRSCVLETGDPRLYGLKKNVESTQTETVYRRAAGQPLTPGFDSDDVEDYEPSGWANDSPGSTCDEKVWKVSRTVYYQDTTFIRADDWGNVSTHLERQTCTQNTDEVFRFSAPTSAPSNPGGGTSSENHLPSGWSRRTLEPTTVLAAWKLTRIRNYENGVFTHTDAWTGPSIEEDVLMEVAST